MVYDVLCFLHVFILAIVSIKECSCLFGVGMDRFALIITLLNRSSFLGESYFYSISPSDTPSKTPASSSPYCLLSSSLGCLLIKNNCCYLLFTGIWPFVLNKYIISWRPNETFPTDWQGCNDIIDLLVSVVISFQT